ncbi:MAG TPA: ABC transporter permease [Candidatus Dormibacteraeota bacterium]
MSSVVQAAPSLKPAVRRHGRAHHFTRTWQGIWTIRAVTLVLILSLWQLLGMNVNAALLVPPSAIVGAFYNLAIASPELRDAIAVSARAWAIGYAAAIVVGVTIGIVMGRFRRVYDVLDPWVFFLYAIPTIAIIPLLVIWFGIDELVRVVLVFLASVFTVIISTSAGVKNVDQDLLDVGRAFCASERQLTRTIVLPAAFPFIFAGVRLAMYQAIVGVIGAEFLVVVTGLGGMILNYANSFQTANMFVPIIAIIAISVILTAVLGAAQKRINRWQYNGIDET